MRIAVTGSCGYIGRHVVAALQRTKGFEVFPVDAVGSNPIDIFSNEDAQALYRRLGSPDALVHLAWKDGFRHDAESHLQFLPWHYRFLTGMIECGCKNVSVMGSMHEVGYYEGCISDEDLPSCDPASAYGIAKNALRQAIFAYVRGKRDVSLKWLRGFYITGDEARASSIFAKILQRSAEGVRSFPFTDGLAKYDFIDVDELSEMITAASAKRGVKEVINVCSGVPVALKDRVEEFLRQHRIDIQLEYGAFPTRPYDSPIVYGSNRKIMRIMKEFRHE